eukprot:scaffold6030_cov68-Phaeocystis_antarctica.AAC.1
MPTPTPIAIGQWRRQQQSLEWSPCPLRRGQSAYPAGPARRSLPPLPTHACSRRPAHVHLVFGRSSRTPHAGGARATPSKVVPLPPRRGLSAYPAGRPRLSAAAAAAVARVVPLPLEA